MLLALLTNNACSCLKTPCSKLWKFELPFNIENHHNTYHVGDTIWMVSEFGSTLQDLNSPDVVNVEDFDFNIDLFVDEVYGTPISFASDRFLLVEESGKLTYIAIQGSPDLGGNPGYLKLQHDYNSGQYSFKYGLVPQMEGVFLISLNSFFNAPYNKINFGSGCNEEMDKILFNMNNKVNNNFNLLSFSPDSRIVEVSEEDFIAGGMFVFTVVP